MKNLILILSLCFVLFSCFEKEEVTIVDEKPIENPTDTTIIDTTATDTTGNIIPVDSVDIMKCENILEFVEQILREAPLQPRADIKKYLYKNSYVYVLFFGGSSGSGVPPYGINSKCEIVCNFGGVAGSNCEDFDKSTFIETIWQDNR